MQKSPTTGWARLARRALAAVAFVLSITGLAMAAQPIAARAAPRIEAAIAARTHPLRPAHARTRPRSMVVWRGQDVDGDGAADFANPTGAAPRDHDDFGSGAFGASRDGGARHHEGVDYVAVAGQVIHAPISGYVTKLGFAYVGDDSLRFVEITNPATRYVARAFYIDATVTVGDVLRMGDAIGRAASLQSHYPGITDHVHLEVIGPSGDRIDAGALIHAVRVKAGGVDVRQS